MIEDEIAFGCENLAFPPDKIQKQIDIVCNLLKLDKSWKCRTLSGGQKQRLITASTLAMGQKIIILDEPLANLDKDGAAMLMGTLRSLAQAGYCVVVIEHRLDMVLPFVDTVWHIGDRTVKRIEDKAAYLQAQTAKIGDSCKPFEVGAPLFTLKNIKFSVKDRGILKDISLEIPKGGRTVFLGENGCGKTTLMRLIARLYKPTGGCITQYIDEKFKQKPRGSRAWFKKVGVVYQNPDYQLFMPTVEKEINFGAPSPEYAEHIAELFGIKHLWHRHPQSLSEGQKRRVSIAAVVACQPEVLLLDEPLSAIDARLRKNLQIEIRRIQQELNITTIFVTHDQDEAMLMSDRICLLNEGKIEQVSTPIELYTKPKTRFAASFIGHYNVLSPDEFLQAFHTAPTDNKMTAIRPETIQISTEKPEENDLTHTLHGRIINNRSVGNTLHYHIDVNGITFKVDTLFRSFALYKNDQDVWLSLEKRNCLALED